MEIKVIVDQTEYRIPSDGDSDQGWAAVPELPSGTRHYGRRKGDVRHEPRDYGGG